MPEYSNYVESRDPIADEDVDGTEIIAVSKEGDAKSLTTQQIANLAGGGGHVIEDEGTPLTQRTKLNFVGAGVTVTDDSGDDATVVTIASGGGTGTVESVTGDGVDNTDPDNPILTFPVASEVVFAPAGTIAAITVQAAIAELDSETANGRAAVDATGTAIAFAVPQFYGSAGSPETGNITLVTTGLMKGMEQTLYHNNGTEPTYPTEFVRIGGVYSTGDLNIITMKAISTTRIEYTISQEI